MEKKLIARVRPGVAETLACREPSKALSRLDLPTFERPRKAISGMEAVGNWAGEWADNRNFEWTRKALVYGRFSGVRRIKGVFVLVHRTIEFPISGAVR